MFVVGLTGGIGCGKTAVSDILLSLGAEVIDTDKIAHALTRGGAAGSLAIADTFGTAMLHDDGSLNRGAMRELVFSNAEARERLEALLHPLILSDVQRTLETSTGPYVVVVVPLLAGAPAYQALCHRILVVDCPEALQIRRVMQRSGLTEDQVKQIMLTQASRAQRLALADDVIENIGSYDELKNKTLTLHKRYLTLAQLHKKRG